MSEPTPPRPPALGAPHPIPPKPRYIALIWAAIITSILFMIGLNSLGDTGASSSSSVSSDMTTTPAIDLPTDSAPPVEDPPATPAPAAHDYWSKFACQRVSEVRAKAQAGLLTEQEVYDLLRDIHGDAVNSSNPSVAAAIESMLRLHTVGGDGTAAAAELKAACAGA